MNVPDRVFAIGGAGKELAFQLLETDWVLRDVLKPRMHPSSMQVTIIDSAEEEAKSGPEGGDYERVKAARGRIKDIKEAYREEAPEYSPGDIEVKFKLLTENIRLVRRLDLLGDKEVERITAGNGMNPDNWWLQPSHINENLDFAKGVIRKRGLSKALYYKSYAEDNLDEVIDLPRQGEVAILVGLGGGTGAGILLDLASHLKQQQSASNITLFGVLPNNAEGEEENANAFALLSELEYRALNDGDPFENRILFSIEPTEYGGKRDKMSPSREHLREFDEAVVYSLLLYYNTEGMQDALKQYPSYAPFTMAIPQLLRYNIEAIEEFRTEVSEYLEDKEASMKAEAQLYDAVDEFMSTHYPMAEGELSDEDRVDFERRIERLEALIDLQLFEDLEYESVATFRTEVIGPARAEVAEADEETEDELGRLIDLMVGSVEAKTLQHLDTAVEDQRVAEVLEQDVLLLGRRRDLLEQLKGVTDPKIRDALEYLVGLREGNAGAKATLLKEEYRGAKERREEAEAALEEVRTELEQLKAEQAAEIERRTDEWAETVSEDVEQLRSLSSIPIQQDVETLRSALQTFRRQLERARSPEEAESVGTTEVEEALGQVEADLEDAGVYVDVSVVTDAVEKARRARVAHFGMYASRGLSKYLPWESGIDKKRKADQKQFGAQRARLRNNRLEILEVGDKGGEFDCKVTFDGSSVFDEVDERQRKLLESVVDAFEHSVDDYRPEDLATLREELRHGSDDDRLRELISEALQRDITGVKELQDRTETLEVELERHQNDEQLYETAHSTVTNLNTYTKEFNDRLKDFRDGLNSLIETSPRRTDVNVDYSFRKDVQPHNVFRATGKSGLAESELLDAHGEKQRVIEYMEELVDRACSEPYCGLQKRKLIADGRRYDELRIHLGLTSEVELKNIDGIVELGDAFHDAFELDKSPLNSPYGQWEQDFGGPWDVGMTTFITGVFLDNLRLAVGPTGYYEIYRKREEKLGEDILIHHSLGLETGHFIRRKGVANVEDIDDIRSYLQDEPSVEQRLIDAFERVPIGGEYVTE